MNCVYFVNCLRSINKNINVSSFFIFILFHWLLCLENECLHRCLFCLFFFCSVFTTFSRFSHGNVSASSQKPFNSFFDDETLCVDGN